MSSCSGNRHGESINPDVLIFFESLPEYKGEKRVNIDSERTPGFFGKNLKNGLKNIKDIAPPYVKDILAFPLIVNGDTIHEIKENARSEKIGEVFCINNKPTIVYYRRMDFMDEYSLAFFRMHEYSHFLLGHKSCTSTNGASPKPDVELEADAKAAELLLQFTDGKRIIDRMHGLFMAMERRRTSTHPSSKERANKLYEE